MATPIPLVPDIGALRDDQLIIPSTRQLGVWAGVPSGSIAWHISKGNLKPVGTSPQGLNYFTAGEIKRFAAVQRTELANRLSHSLRMENPRASAGEILDLAMKEFEALQLKIATGEA